MKFGPVPLQEAVGALVAHSVRTPERVFKKGQVLTEDDIAVLRSAGIDAVTVARLEPGDVPEDEAAARIARRLAGENIRVAAAFTGRANLFATADGLVTIDADCIADINAVDESITVATVAPDRKSVV